MAQEFAIEVLFLTSAAFAASFANAVTLGALKLCPNLHQRPAASRTGRLALLFGLLVFRLRIDFTLVVSILELHLIQPLPC